MDGKVAGYRTPSRILHWLVAALVIATIPAGMIMIQEGLARPTQNALFLFHKNIGIVILLLVLARLAYRMLNPAPPLPASIPDWQRRAAGVSHAALYVLLLVMAVSGYIRVKAGGFPIEYLDAMGVPSLVAKSEPVANTAKAIHFYTRYVLIAFIALHFGAALHHGLVKRDGVFSRMWPPVRS